MADDENFRGSSPPMNVYTAMLLLAFVAISIGCLVIALDLSQYNFEIKPNV